VLLPGAAGVEVSARNLRLLRRLLGVLANH
jgi:hypothetical protein